MDLQQIVVLGLGVLAGYTFIKFGFGNTNPAPATEKYSDNNAGVPINMHVDKILEEQAVLQGMALDGNSYAISQLMTRHDANTVYDPREV